MGCAEAKDKVPILFLNFEPNNDQQRQYCMKFKNECHPPYNINFVLYSRQEEPFCIKLQIRNIVHLIQAEYNDSQEEMNKALNDIYQKLKEAQ